MTVSTPSSFLRRIGRRWPWLLALLVAAAAAGAWWQFHYVPQRVEQLYAQAVEEYGAGDYARATSTLEQAYALNSRVVRVNILLGWSHWRQGEAKQAEYYFARAHRLDPASEEAKKGLAFASLAIDKVTVALSLFEELGRKHPDDKEIQLALGEAYSRSGQNLSAARVYRAMLERDPEDQDAREAFLALYGYPDYRPDLPLTFSPTPPPAEAQVFFRTQGNYFQALDHGRWRTVYIVGVNLGPARPGEFPATGPRDFFTYREWLKQIAAMNANTVRVYTLLPPAFYQALRAYNEAAQAPLWLIQEVWVHDEAENLYDPARKREFEQDLVNVIDVLHGQADVGCRRGHYCGIYTADVSRYVLALAVGREMEPRVALITNRDNPARISYHGRYINLEQGNPTEVWFAEMCDRAVGYEVEKYNTQRPLTVVNWPPLDPIDHSTEATYEEELQIRKRLGEIVPEELPPVVNDADVVSLDVMKFKTGPEFVAGLFALYHVYQHWPDFLLHEPHYELAQDVEGPNRYLGYLQELKQAHAGFPLLIGEYGVATSLAAAHLHPQGWHNGGLTEEQQAELLVRFTKNIAATGCAGGVVFEWQDEWFKHVHDFFTADFERPWSRDPLWLNALDPEENFGLVGYAAAGTVPLLRGEPRDWQDAHLLYYLEAGEEVSSSPGAIQAVYAMSDLAYFYLRVDVATPPSFKWSEWDYWIALSTLSGQAGSQLLPDIQVRLESGANFLIQLPDPSSGRILVAENYNPNQPILVAGRPGETRISRKQGMKVELSAQAKFEEIMTEPNLPRYARDGRVFPPLNYSRSPLPYGTADRARAGFSSHALWHLDSQAGMIELRIPWGLLLVTDPSRLQAFGGTDEKWLPLSVPTKGISVAVFAIQEPGSGDKGTKTVVSSVPPIHESQLDRKPAVFTWEPWDRVPYRPYFKRSYFALQEAFAEMRRRPIGLAGR